MAQIESALAAQQHDHVHDCDRKGSHVCGLASFAS